MKSIDRWKSKPLAMALAAVFALSGCVTSHGVSETHTVNTHQSAVNEGQVSGTLPLAHGMTRRVLANGLTVLYYPRTSPQGGVEIRLVVRAGSLQEAENERGLAHYVEHMAFNGTRDYSGQTIFKALEAEGIMLGADVNAVTSLAGTTYKLSLPKKSRTSLDKAMHIMSQWAFHLSFEPAAFEREREIIVEEWRLREGMGARINGPLQTLRYEGSAARDRDPIGLIDVVRGAPVERAKAFYERWYTPENMTLLVVGDFDEQDVDRAVATYFGEMPQRGQVTPVDWGRFHHDQDEDALTTLVLDPEVSDRFVQIQCQRTLSAPANTVNEAWRELLERLTLDILSQRFSLLADDDDSVRIQAPESNWTLSPSETQVLFIARPKVGTTLAESVRRTAATIQTLATFGPRTEELQAVIAKHQNRVLEAAKTQAYRENGRIAETYADAVIYRLPMLDAQQEAEMVTTFLAAVTPDHIRAVAKDLLASQIKLGAVASSSEEVTKKALRAAWQKGVTTKAHPWVLKPQKKTFEVTLPKMTDETKQVDKALLPSPTANGHLERFTFKNGLTLMILEDRTLKGKVMVNVRAQGGTSVVDDGVLSVPAALTLPMRSGIGALDSKAIRRAAKGAGVSIMSYAEGLYHGIRAESQWESFPMLMALLSARIQSPKMDPSALKEMVRQKTNDLAHTPAERRFMEAIAGDAFTHGESLTVDRADVAALDDVGRLTSLEGRLLGDPTKLVVTVVSKESIADVYRAVAPWLATLTPRSQGFTSWVDRGIRPNQKTGQQVWPWASAEKTMVQMHYRTNLPWSKASQEAVTLIGHAANRALREKLRTEASGVYVVTLNPLLVKEPTPYFLGRLNFTAAPERAESLVRWGDATLKTLARDGIDQETFEAVKAQHALMNEKAQTQTAYWCEALAQTMAEKDAIEALKKTDDVTLAEVNECLKGLFGDEPRVYLMTPKKDSK